MAKARHRATAATQTQTILKDLIKEARKSAANPNSQPSIQMVLLRPQFVRRVLNDKRVLMALLSRAWSEAIRVFLKTQGDDDDDIPQQDQLEMWATVNSRARAIVDDIRRKQVYVPSRLEFVPLLPRLISPAECAEAGEFLLEKGRENIREGNLLLKLGQLHWFQ